MWVVNFQTSIAWNNGPSIHLNQEAKILTPETEYSILQTLVHKKNLKIDYKVFQRVFSTSSTTDIQFYVLATK